MNVLVADGHALVADAISHAIIASAGLHAETSATLSDALLRVETNGPYDVVLLDYHLHGMENLAGLEKIIAANGRSVALFSGHLPWAVIERALALGAKGFVSKKIAMKSFINAVRFLAEGETYLPPEVFGSLQSHHASEKLLKAVEQNVLSLLCEGRQNKEIARSLGLTEVAVKMHVKSICGKLGAKNRTQAVIFAQRENLL